MNSSHFLRDSFLRKIDYVRISLNEDCNFRCVYCYPREYSKNNYQKVEKKKYLSKDEIINFVKAIADFGVEHIRLSGGEPLLRKDIVEIVREIKKIESIKDISITTNASLLDNYLCDLKAAGLTRINISLDSLNQERFFKITGSNLYEKVLTSIYNAIKLNFRVKLNMVAMSDITEAEIISYVSLAYKYPIEVRFIEFMPLCGDGWQPQLMIPMRKIKNVVNNYFNLAKIPSANGVAEVYNISNGNGRVGFIASLTEPFCDKCSRIRLSAYGIIRPCLFSNLGVSIREHLNDGEDYDKVIEKVKYAISIKPEDHGVNNMRNTLNDPNANPSTNQITNPKENPMIYTIGG